VDKWIKGNFKQVGFYRVHYDDDNWNALIKQLNTDHTVSTEFVIPFLQGFRLTLLSPDIKMHILLTVLHPFL